MTGGESMREKKLRETGEAIISGQMEIMYAAIEALIAVSPKPDYIQFRLAQCLATLQNEKPAHPSLAWATEATNAGAAPLAQRFIAACQENLAVDR